MVASKTEIVCTYSYSLRSSEFASDKHILQLFKFFEFIIIFKKVAEFNFESSKVNTVTFFFLHTDNTYHSALIERALAKRILF